MNKLSGTLPLGRYEIVSGGTITAGDLVCINSSGKALAAADEASISVIGVAAEVEDGFVEVVDGIYGFANDTTAPVARKDRGATAYVKDAKTVAISGGTNAVAAGIIVDVYDGEVFVDTTPAAVKAAKAN